MSYFMHVKMLFQKWVMCTKFEIYLFITVAPIINISLLEVVIDQFKGKNPCGIQTSIHIPTPVLLCYLHDLFFRNLF